MKVKRYNLTNPYDCGMEKHPTGKYVLFEDYKQMCDYADRLVEHKNMVCLPADLKNLREANAHFATENEMLKNAIANNRDAAATEGEEITHSEKLVKQRDLLIEVLEVTLNATVLNHRRDRWHSDAEYALNKIKLNLK